MGPGQSGSGLRAGVATSGKLASEVLRQLRSTYGPAVIESASGSVGLYLMPGQVGLFARRCRDPVVVASAGGVGAKAELARRVGRHDTVGTDLVAACVNELLAQAAAPLFLISHVAAAALPEAAHLQLVKGITEGCRQADCALLACETTLLADSPGPGGYVLSGFAVGMVERARLLHGSEKTRPGDVVLGIAASGLHTSGFPLASRVLLDAGAMDLDAAPPELGCTLAEALLAPSRIYARALRAVLERYRVKGVVHGLAHVADGGLVARLPRILGRRCVARIQKAAMPRLPIFDLIQRVGGVPDEEMFRTLNMGIGMAVVVAPFYADAAIRRVKRAGDAAVAIGEIVRGDGPAVELV